ncbi:unnamed protein product [Trifolium pratense]|uniref:Uncharacterized protein n=1 Tax=Trifolium pratense TaxID=57577 RepID=A0ACB0ITB1_TRIPR|nr:unnamed protein product [Trifolium pratense]
MVMPVFYDVDPSVVLHQQGAFGKKLHATAENRYLHRELREITLLSWKSALTQAASLIGWDATNYRIEAELMQQIVGDILRKLKRGIPGGMELHVRKVTELIVNQSSKVSWIGIWGMGGSGKTTTAKAIYNRLQDKFLNTSFIENVKKVCELENSGIIHLQQQLLSDILKTNMMIRSIAEGEMMISERFQGKKVLVVLDDVTTFDQLKALCANGNLFGPGSVIIVTTRDVQLLNLSMVDYVYIMEEMDENESLELFSWYAFRQPSPIKDFNELSRNVIAYCIELPLVLEVLGSYLFAKTKQEWLSVLSKLKRIPNDQVHEKLRISYDGLEDIMVKDIFLDICCFFIGKDRDYVTDILNGCGLYADVGIAVLIERRLVKIEKNNKLGMHDLIRDMGREIVRKSSTEEPGKRSRLWIHDDVDDVLTKYTGTETVKGLVLKSQGTGRVSFNTNSFKEMKKLRLLQLDRVDLTGDYGNLSKELKWVHWQGFTCNFIPDDFHQENLVVFELKHSNIKQVWNETKVLVNLKILNISHSRYLKSTPDFSKLPYLEKLIMKDCPCLSEIHPSIGDLNNLLLINLKDCTGLNNLPKKIYQLKSLKTLILSGCLKIDKLEEDIKQMESLITLIAKNTAIKEVPFSIVLVNLKILNLSHSRYLKSSPDFSKLPNLEKLIMKDCPCLSEIHPSIGDLNNLHLINLKDCTGLGNLSEKIFQQKSLITLNLSGCLKIDEKHADEKNVSKNDVDAKSKGGSSRCDNQRDVDEARKRHVEILNQSEDADDKGALVNNVDVNRRLINCFAFDRVF